MAGGLRIFLLAASIGIGLGWWPSGPAVAAPYAAIVMDMRDGRVMHSRGADRRQHPASLTKLMTLYLAFEAVENGQLRLGQKVRVSRKAAQISGSQLRLRAGERVSIRDLIRATAIKSANDAAITLAEAIAGSEAAFAKLMTRKAQQLGMNSTTYKNAHGLTKAGHLTTARDQARLARALYFDFPQYYNVFGRKSERAAGRNIWTTNRLLRSYSGIEGMKTGYTRAAGYNLVATANRGSKRVIAVLMGGTSSTARFRRVAQLLDMGFKRAETRVATARPSYGGRIAADSSPLPPPRGHEASTGLAALAEALGPSTAEAALPSRSSRTGTRHAPRRSDLPPRAERAAPAGLTVDPNYDGPPIPPRNPRRHWEVLAGSYTDEAGAVARLAAIAGKPELQFGSARSWIGKRNAKGRTVFDVRFAGLSKGEAASFCARLDRFCESIEPGR